MIALRIVAACALATAGVAHGAAGASIPGFKYVGEASAECAGVMNGGRAAPAPAGFKVTPGEALKASVAGVWKLECGAKSPQVVYADSANYYVLPADRVPAHRVKALNSVVVNGQSGKVTDRRTPRVINELTAQMAGGAHTNDRCLPMTPCTYKATPAGANWEVRVNFTARPNAANQPGADGHATLRVDSDGHVLERVDAK